VGQRPDLRDRLQAVRLDGIGEDLDPRAHFLGGALRSKRTRAIAEGLCGPEDAMVAEARAIQKPARPNNPYRVLCKACSPTSPAAVNRSAIMSSTTSSRPGIACRYPNTAERPRTIHTTPPSIRPIAPHRTSPEDPMRSYSLLHPGLSSRKQWWHTAEPAATTTPASAEANAGHSGTSPLALPPRQRR
jgi:hypothetical protein